MRRLALAVVLVAGLASPAWADFDDGMAAYERGDYGTALKEFRPLAEQGDADTESLNTQKAAPKNPEAD